MFPSTSAKSCSFVLAIASRPSQDLCWIAVKSYSSQVSLSSFVFFCYDLTSVGYTYDEKLHIARRFLLPKQISVNGLKEDQVNITEPALLHIATRYTREAGVRSLERAIGAVVRFKAVEWAEYLDGEVDSKMLTDGSGNEMTYSSVVEESDLEKMLGISRWEGEEKEREETRGVVFGLVVMGQGEGGIMPIETMMVPGNGSLKLTGSLGDVRAMIASSIQVACMLTTRAGNQGKLGDISQLGKAACVRHGADECEEYRSPQGREYRHPSAPACWGDEERWT